MTNNTNPVRGLPGAKSTPKPAEKEVFKAGQKPADANAAKSDEKKKTFGEKATDFATSPRGRMTLIGGVIATIMLVGAGTMMLGSGGDTVEEPTTAVEAPATTNDFQEVQPTGPQHDYFSATRVLEALPADNWARSHAPVDELMSRAVDQAFVQSPYWDPQAMGIKMGPAHTFTAGTPEYNQIKNASLNRLRTQIESEIKMEPNQEVGKPALVSVRNTADAIAAGEPEFKVITQASDYELIMSNAVQKAAPEVSAVITEYKTMIPQELPQEEPPKIVEVDNGITAAQRAEFVRLLEEQKSWNEELRRDNQRLKEELQTMTKQTADLMQKVEDSPKAQNNLKAHMLAKESGYKLQAIQGDIVFLEDKSGKVHSLKIGQTIPGTDMAVANADANTGIVYVTKK